MNVKLEDINRKIVRMYRTALEASGIEGADVVAEDVRSPITRPCGKVELDENSAGALMLGGAEKTATFRLYYFATSAERPKLENLMVREAIAQAFLDGIMLEDIHLPISEGVAFTVTDGVLVATLDLLWQEHREESGEMMEYLYYNDREVAE